MEVEYIIKIEFPALSKTIMDYTTDYFIYSYAEQICLVDSPQDYDVLLILISKLIEWYSEEIKLICNGEYIYNKESHQKSFDLLLKTKEMLVKHMKIKHNNPISKQ